MKNFFMHFRQYVVRGLLALIPIGLTIITIQFIYVFIDKRVMELVYLYTGYKVPGLGLLIFVLVLYLVGMIASNVIGKRIFALLDTIMIKIPLIKTAYQVGKQVSNTLSLPEQQIFQRALLVDYFKPKAWVIGFVTGQVKNPQTGEILLKIFIPTVPNPTSGFLVIIPESSTINPQWSVEEAMKMVISGGIIGPDMINL